jgi:hypothetical protein
MLEPIPFIGWIEIGEDMPAKILDITHPYVNSQKTNIAETFRRHGFCFPTESLWYQEKWFRFRNSNTINESKG